MSGLKRFFYLFLGLYMMIAGVLHFVLVDTFLSFMPPYIPYHKMMVYLSGVVELLLGSLLLTKRYRVLAAWGIVLLLIAVFPANIYVYQEQVIEAPHWVHVLRLLLQPVLILWAFWFTRPIKD